MALVNYPDQIEVTLGRAWTGKNGLSANDVIVLEKVDGENAWSESGGSTVNTTTNRLKLGAFHYEDAGWVDVDESVSVYNDDFGYAEICYIEDSDSSPGGAYDSELEFKQLWLRTDVNSPMEDFEDLELAGFLDWPYSYNNEIFSSMDAAACGEVNLIGR